MYSKQPWFVDGLTILDCVSCSKIVPPYDVENLFGGRLAMDRLLGWFPHNHREWIEFIIVALLLWLLMVVAISELELTSIS